MSTPPAPSRIVLRAPNWLGDAVLALPAMAAVRRAFPRAELTVAAPAVARGALPRGDGRAARSRDRAGRQTARRDQGAGGRQIRPGHPLSELVSIGLAAPARARARAMGLRDVGTRGPAHAQEPAREGQRAAASCRLLSRARARPRCGVRRRVAAYRRDAPPAPSAPRRCSRRSAARSTAPIVAFAPGAAYGQAKQWPPDRVAAVIAQALERAPRDVGDRRRGARSRRGACDRILAARARAGCARARRRSRRPDEPRRAGRRGRAMRGVRDERFRRDARRRRRRPAGRRVVRADR